MSAQGVADCLSRQGGIGRNRLRSRRRRTLARFPARHRARVFIGHEDGERFIEGVRGDERELAARLRIEREPEAGELN